MGYRLKEMDKMFGKRCKGCGKRENANELLVQNGIGELMCQDCLNGVRGR